MRICGEGFENVVGNLREVLVRGGESKPPRGVGRDGVVTGLGGSEVYQVST